MASDPLKSLTQNDEIAHPKTLKSPTQNGEIADPKTLKSPTQIGEIPDPKTLKSWWQTFRIFENLFEENLFGYICKLFSDGGAEEEGAAAEDVTLKNIS